MRIYMLFSMLALVMFIIIVGANMDAGDATITGYAVDMEEISYYQKYYGDEITEKEFGIEIKETSALEAIELDFTANTGVMYKDYITMP